MAVEYGADAVYLGSQLFSMRASPENFTLKELAKAVDYAHSRGVKVYLTCNTVPHNNEILELPQFLTQSADTGIDAFIISDVGVMDYAKRYAPQIEVHISTQAGVVNFASANTFFNMGAKRVVLAREMSLAEIKQLRENTPSGLEIEAFVHERCVYPSREDVFCQAISPHVTATEAIAPNPAVGIITSVKKNARGNICRFLRMKAVLTYSMPVIYV